MKVVFLGVGEACDERLGNTALWMQSEISGQRKSVLFDCGFTVPPLYWQQTTDPEDLDGLWISHFHGDHFFGLPALMLRFWEMKRQKTLTIIGQTGIKEIVIRCMALAYPHFLEKLTYPLEFISVEPQSQVTALGLSWGFGVNAHGQRDLAVRVEDGKCAFFYSGDGQSTPDTVSLARGCDLVVHEAFRLDQPVHGHGTIRQCIDFAREARVSTLALVHLQRDERRERYQDVLNLIEGVEDLHVILPEPGDELEF